MFASSGPSYREWSVSRQSIMVRGSDRDWSRRRHYYLFSPGGIRGPRSLVDMTIHVVAANIGSISEAHFEAIPNRLLWRIYEMLEARGVCLHAWKIFSKVLTTEQGDKPLGLYRYRKHICRPTGGLKVYTQPILSPTAEFLTHLVISGGCQFSTNELLCLAGLRNLVALELVQPADELSTQFSEINDRLFRGWSEVNSPFPLLRVLRIRVGGDITSNSLRWVQKFPSLAVYDVTADKHDWEEPYASGLPHDWEIAPCPRMDESLLQRLMMIAPKGHPESDYMKSMAAEVDKYLRSLCDDSRCPVRFVPNRGAPPLLDNLMDAARAYIPSWSPNPPRSEGPFCQRISFEAWAFWLCSFIGQICGDEDLHSHGCNVDTQAVTGSFVLPSRPMVSLFLGHNGRDGISNDPLYVRRGLFSIKQMTFIRRGFATRGGDAAPGASSAASTGTKHTRSDGPSDSQEPSQLRSDKKQRLADLLQSFGR
ncbi:hypothetical protein E4U42_003594 [Claviceps africana]|uniref:Uncharacterized protein n=1 Tax=Claviceps africana TaxID=83212 RepID=A0A8K0J7L5_9HYPO|nr:hypothetical protein E4U42_003594 [Claviceps africana]